MSSAKYTAQVVASSASESLPLPEVAAVAIADVVESADAPFRSVVPDVAGEQARFDEFVSDADFRALCLAADHRSFSRAQRNALANAAERARQV